MMSDDRIEVTVNRMKDAERQRFEAGEMPGHVLCTCGHVLRAEVVDYHKAVSFLHRDESR